MKSNIKFIGLPLALIGIIFISTQCLSCNNGEWWNRINGLSDEEINNLEIGTTNTVVVNGIKHTVRLIGKNHDIQAIEGSQVNARTTWEFVNPICDKDGYSLTTFWDESGNNHNFLNSTLRSALDGQVHTGDNPSSIVWYTKDGHKKSTIYTKSVIDMLPSGLVNCMKKVRKKVHIATGAASGAYSESWNKENDEVELWNTKIFIPSITEISNNPQTEETKYKDGNIYEYYDDLVVSKRIKHQIKGKEGSNKGRCDIYINDSTFTYEEDKDTHEIKKGALNFAGYESDGNDKGCNYWLRSPRWNYFDGQTKVNDVDGYYINEDGELKQTFTNQYALPVTPCFCI